MLCATLRIVLFVFFVASVLPAGDCWVKIAEERKSEKPKLNGTPSVAFANSVASKIPTLACVQFPSPPEEIKSI
nr:hypothetical protein HmN_000865800 [Hymenolepis microstoma]